MAITLEQAKQLYKGQELFHDWQRNSDGSPTVWRVNGAVKTWKRSPERVQVPIKHGLYAFDYLTESSLDLVHLTAADALGAERYKVTVKTFKAHKRVDVRDILSSNRWSFKFNLSWSTSNFHVRLDPGPVLFYDADGAETGIVLSDDNRR